MPIFAATHQLGLRLEVLGSFYELKNPGLGH